MTETNRLTEQSNGRGGKKNVQKNGYQNIKDYISDKIRSRQWPPGHLLPTETELATQFDCARATVNRALGELAEEQIIDRRRKAGSRVRDGRERKANLKILFPCREVEAMGMRHRYVSLSREVCALPTLLLGPDSTDGSQDCVQLAGIHYADEEPFQYEEAWIRKDLFPSLSIDDGRAVAPCLTLLQKNPFYHGSIRITVSKATQGEARYLGLRTGEPLLNKEYILTDGVGGTPVALMQLHYKPDYSIASAF
ncbi:GntR family transcriptional regulator [uncultured Cohaesibacter sp.]|uniref:GntR family transcriptional regulator n=1 Tax=uncultured Cohaesibacter sp. TaxID=1002546 RepID=UPI0029C87186|nr:GntR family transcriptional regulator [uncultured Cohaesibacter sp.]